MESRSLGSSSRHARHVASYTAFDVSPLRVLHKATMFLLPLLSLLAVPLSVLAAKQSPHDTLVKLAAANNGVIRLNAEVFDLLTAPTRDWTSSVQFTALDKKRRCAPCKCVSE